MGHLEILAALRRHFDSPERHSHVTFPGGISFLEEDRMVSATDEQVLEILTERNEEKRRRRVVYRLLRDLPLPDDEERP